MPLTSEEFEARQIQTLRVSEAEYHATYVTVRDSAGFFETVRRDSLEKSETSDVDAPEVAQ